MRFGFRRSVQGTVLLALVALSAHAQPAVERRKEIRRFTWGSALIQVEASADYGVQLWLAGGDNTVLTWFAPDSIAAWTATVDTLVAMRVAASDTGATHLRTPSLVGADSTQLYVQRDVSRRGSTYSLLVARQGRGQSMLLQIKDSQARELARALAAAAPAGWQMQEQARFSGGLDAAYGPSEVSSVASAYEGNRAPQYARDIASRWGGVVFVSFVVDSTGTPDPATFEVHDASHPMNGQAVRDILPSWRFRPALKDGHPVRMRLAMTIPVEVGNHVQTTNTDRALPSTKPTP